MLMAVSEGKRQMLWRTGKRIVMVLATAGLLLSLLIVGTTDSASAQAGDVTEALQVDIECPIGALGTAGACYELVAKEGGCAEGVPFDDVCRVLVSFGVNGPASCPVSSNIFSDGNECFFLVEPDANGDCFVGTTVDPSSGQCRRPVDLVPGPLGCPDGGTLLGTECSRYEPRVGATCPAGATLDEFGSCRAPVADRADRLVCVPGGELVGTECVFTVPATGNCSYNNAIIGCDQLTNRCPDGFGLDQFGLRGCVRAEMASQSPPSCVRGSFGLPGNCYILVAPLPAADSSSAATEPGCPPRSFEHPVDETCRQPVAPGAGFFFCESAFASLSGRACVTTADFAAPCSDLVGATVAGCEGDAQCPANFATDAADPTICTRTEPALVASASCPIQSLGSAGGCYRYVNERPVDPVPCPEFSLFDGFCQITGTPNTFDFVCPVSTTVLEDGDECFTLVRPPLDAGGNVGECPRGTTPHADGVLCRRPVALVAVPAFDGCDVNFDLIGNRCLRFQTPQSAGSSCGLVVDATGRCRLELTDSSGEFYCEDPTTTLSGSLCFRSVGGPPAVPSESGGGSSGVVPARGVFEPPLDEQGGEEAGDAPVATVEVESATAAATTAAASDEALGVTELAITGTETSAAALALSMLGAGAGLLGVARVRRRKVEVLAPRHQTKSL